MRLGSVQSNWVALVLGFMAAAQLAQVNGNLIHNIDRLAKEGIRVGKHTHPYKQINKDLCKKLKSDDYELNAKLATKWYDEAKEQAVFLLRKNQLRAMALELITEAERQRQAGTWCQGNRIADLSWSNKREIMQHVAQLRQRQPEGALKCNRVFQMFFRQTLDHLEECPKFYQDNLRRVVEHELNEFRLKDGDRVLVPLIGALQKHLQIEPVNFELVQTLRQQLVDGQLDAPLIELTAKSLSESLRFHSVADAKLELVRSHVFHELNEYIYQPCTYLSVNLRATLGPASLDLENLDEFWDGGKQLPDVVKQFSSYGPDVYKLWSKYLLCDKLLELNYAKIGEMLIEKVLHMSDHHQQH